TSPSAENLSFENLNSLRRFQPLDTVKIYDHLQCCRVGLPPESQAPSLTANPLAADFYWQKFGLEARF
ncbi:MAG: hypothetical protein PUG95_05825, partial [Firmicutes bacterium]|nr:hypothetical protein [Bacillota bacterium]